jgi:hypothetical protein
VYEVCQWARSICGPCECTRSVSEPGVSVDPVTKALDYKWLSSEQSLQVGSFFVWLRCQVRLCTCDTIVAQPCSSQLDSTTSG